MRLDASIAGIWANSGRFPCLAAELPPDQRGDRRQAADDRDGGQLVNAPHAHGPGLPGTAEGASDLRWRRAFLGQERQLGELRRWLAGLLPDRPARDDVVLVAVELATNAVKFTCSGNGGWFIVEITWYRGTVRVAVADGGAPTGPMLIEDPLSEHGRGLQMVRALSVATGVMGGEGGRLVWADVPWGSVHETRVAST